MRDDIATASPDITDLGDGVFQIDTKMAGYQGITAGYLIRSSRPCLVETGTSTSAPVVRAAIAALGIEPADLATVVVTHIHLDHAGGVGDIASMFPSAEVVVHEKGARHLADPSRLMASARMVYADALDVLFGRLAAVPADRLRTLDDVGVIDLGDGRRLERSQRSGSSPPTWPRSWSRTSTSTTRVGSGTSRRCFRRPKTSCTRRERGTSPTRRG